MKKNTKIMKFLSIMINLISQEFTSDHKQYPPTSIAGKTSSAPLDEFHLNVFFQLWPFLCDVLNEIYSASSSSWIEFKDCVICLNIMTKNRLMVAFDSNKGPNLKVVKWCLKRWNGPILMHIYDKQCKIIQKSQKMTIADKGGRNV